jgi:hypothetical protein
MALQQITPTPAHVRWDRRLGLPATVRFADRQLTVTSVDTVRDETAAYPVGRGPRITYLVETDAGQASLVFDSRARRWFIDALEPAA